MESFVGRFPSMERDCTYSLLGIKKVLRASRLFLLLLARISMVVFGEKSSCILGRSGLCGILIQLGCCDSKGRCSKGFGLSLSDR